MIFENELVNALAFVGLLIPAIILHEIAHGAVAFNFGDTTARDAGRLTLNPIPHVDPFGSVLLPALLAFSGAPVFGWAKPVPVMPRYFADPRKGMAIVGIAGPLTNLALAWLSGIALNILNPTGTPRDLIVVFAVVNVALAIFNMIPIPPLDGSRLLPLVLNENGRKAYAKVEPYGFLILFGLIIVSRRADVSLFAGPINFVLHWVVGI
ncbi:MAG: site-2 protease family protein [Acidimicrobiia bacterium]